MPVFGAVKAMNVLSRSYKLVIVTSKPDSLKTMTHTWVEKYFPNVFQGIYFTNTYVTPKQGKIKKSELCHELGIEIFIDDSIGNVLDVANVCERVFLLDRPWNQQQLTFPDNVTRSYSWQEIVDLTDISSKP